MLRIFTLLMFLGILGGVGVVGYAYWTERSAIQEAKDLLADGEYRDASRVLRRLGDSRFLRREQQYLQALAEIKEYASEDEDQQSTSDPLRTPQRSLKRLFEASEEWRRRAESDLADVLSEIPSEAPDFRQRGLIIVHCLDDLDVGQIESHAKELLRINKQQAEQRGRSSLDLPFIEQVLAWDPSLGAEVIALTLPGPEANQYDLSRGLGEISRCISEHPALKDPLTSSLLECGRDYSKSGRYAHAGVVFAELEQMDPGLREKTFGLRLGLAKQCLEAGDSATALQVLSQAGEVPPGNAAQVSQLYLELAQYLRGSDQSAGRQALERGLAIAPDLAQDEDAALLRIELNPQPDDAKLGACLGFLSSFPESPRRGEVLRMLIRDATEFAKSQPSYGRDRAQGYLAAGSDAAKRLLEEAPKTPGLDVLVFELAKATAGDGRSKPDLAAAVALAKQLLEEMPDTELATQIELAVAQWDSQLYAGSTLPPELRDLADLVEKELKIMSLTTGGAVGVLETNPRAHHVVAVAQDCTANRFNSQQADALKRWVYGGGILWCTNDVLRLFDVEYQHGSTWMGRTSVPSVTADVHPVVTGCENVDLSFSGEATNLAHVGVIPLLSRDGVTRWSLVPYGRGWISDRKWVDESTHDGARFSLNFRLFCLGWAIPGAPTGGRIAELSPGGSRPVAGPSVSPLPPGDQPTVVATVSELDKVLADLDAQRVVWVQLERSAVADDQVAKLQAWVDQGGVLWLDTNLGTEFGFEGWWQARTDQIPPEALIAPRTNHPILDGLSVEQKTAFSMAPGRHLLAGRSDDFGRRGTVALLGWPVSENRAFLVSAVRVRGRGQVVFRPREIDSSNATGRRFNENLRSWSFKVAPPARPDAAE